MSIFSYKPRENTSKSPFSWYRDTFKMIAISFRLSANVIADGKFFARWFHFCSLRYRHRHDGKRRSETNRAKTERKSERKSNELVNWSIFTLITIDKSMQRERERDSDVAWENEKPSTGERFEVATKLPRDEQEQKFMNVDYEYTFHAYKNTNTHTCTHTSKAHHLWEWAGCVYMSITHPIDMPQKINLLTYMREMLSRVILINAPVPQKIHTQRW